MATREDHSGKLKCSCGKRGKVEFWEWENPMHHGADFSSFYVSHTGHFAHLGSMKFECRKCGKAVPVV